MIVDAVVADKTVMVGFGILKAKAWDSQMRYRITTRMIETTKEKTMIAVERLCCSLPDLFLFLNILKLRRKQVFI